MLPKDMTEFDGYPSVKKFIEARVTPHFADARGLLLLRGFNFIVADGLCSIVGGLSTTLWKPGYAIEKADKNGRLRSYYMDGADQKTLGTRKLFIELLEGYYPWEIGEAGPTKAQEVYELIRCPFSHMLGEDAMPGLNVRVVKGKGPKQEEAWTEEEAVQIETAAARPFGLPLAWQGVSLDYVLCVESFYRGLYGLLRNLARDAAQMRAADQRFAAGDMVWHKP